MSFKMVIVTGQAGTLKQAEQYLKNRQWDVYCTENLKDGISEAVVRRADFVMISADHPNRRVKNLPRLISQACPTARLIGYIENNSRAAINALSEMHFDYVVYPPVSGPAVERTVLKILKDEREVGTKKTGRPESQSSLMTTKDEVFVAKGEKLQNAVYNMQSGGTRNTSSEALRRDMMKALGTATVAESGAGGGQFSYGGSLLNPSFGAVTKSPENRSHSAANQDGVVASQLKAIPPASGLPKHYSEVQDSASEAPVHTKALPEIEDDASASDPYQADWSQVENRGMPKVEDPAESPGVQAKASQSNPFSDSLEKLRPSEGLGVSEAKQSPSPFKRDPAQMPEQQSLLAQSIERALEESVNAKGVGPVEPLAAGCQFAAIVVSSERFSGYLIAALGNDRVVDYDFMVALKTKIVEILRAQGINIKDSEPMQLELEPVALEDWAFDQARFMKKAVHNDKEFAIAYFHTEELGPELEQSEVQHMLKLKIEKLELESDLDFDLYMYMPINNKLLLYTPNGRRVEREQKDRLLEKGIGYLHLKKESHVLAQRYHARARLNEKILQFRSRNHFVEV